MNSGEKVTVEELKIFVNEMKLVDSNCKHIITMNKH